MTPTPNYQVAMVNPRGRVIWARQHEVPTLLTEGFKLITNPTQTYYPQYDQTIAPKVADTNIIDGIETTLQVEVI